MSLPGAPRWPLLEGVLLAARRPRRRARKPRAERQLAIALTAPVVAAATGGPAREVAADMGARTGRPETYEHPLAIAARLGRRNYNATHDDIPDPTDPAQRRAFDVAYARSRAHRWGWKSEHWARCAGRDNRRARKARMT